MTRLLAVLAFALAQSALPSGPLAMRDFRLQFNPASTFTLDGDPEWPPMSGTWSVNGNEILLKSGPGSKPCANDARYTWSVDGARFGLDVINDSCVDRRMILDRSRWLLPGTAAATTTRNIVRTAGIANGPLRAAKSSDADWPTLRGREASGVSEKQNLPDTWTPATGQNVSWKMPIPGLAHSSPIFDGGLRWSVDLGRVDMGAYDIPAYEWGPASSPIIWNGLVIVQCDTQGSAAASAHRRSRRMERFISQMKMARCSSFQLVKPSSISPRIRWARPSWRRPPYRMV